MRRAMRCSSVLTRGCALVWLAVIAETLMSDANSPRALIVLDIVLSKTNK
jgi:hypothetical protein